MSALPDLPPPDHAKAGAAAKKAKTVKTQVKKKIVNHVSGLPVLPPPDGMFTGSPAKVGMLSTGSPTKRMKQVKKAKKVKKDGDDDFSRGEGGRSRTYLRSRGSMAQILVHWRPCQLE